MIMRNWNWSMFVLGMRDSLSLYWIRKVLLQTHPTTKNIHPSSLVLLATLKNTLIQVLVFLIGVPMIFRFFNQEILAQTFSYFFLILTYGYLFFYNTDVMNTTKQVALWSSRFPHTHFCSPDYRERVQLFYSLSNQVKSFVFLLLYYTPIFIACLFLSQHFTVLGSICLLLSESFFNSTFYFLKKWPYDRYNIAFIQRNIAYMMGYGFFVSFVCNLILSGEWARGAYFIFSQWMIINCVLFSPPSEPVPTMKDIIPYLKSDEKRSQLQNGYNLHRQRIRTDKEYRKTILQDIVFLKPALIITEKLNSMLSSRFQSQHLTTQPTIVTPSSNSNEPNVKKESL